MCALGCACDQGAAGLFFLSSRWISPLFGRAGELVMRERGGGGGGGDGGGGGGGDQERQ